MAVLVTFLSGLIFGLGLVISGLSNPAKVLNFLDVAGSWDPSLLFTMGAAVMTTAAGFALVFKRSGPLFAEVFHLPTVRDIDAKLVAGAVLFGAGWGLVGYCPGPALTAIVLGNTANWIFVAAMLAGMVVGRMVQSRPPTGHPARA